MTSLRLPTNEDYQIMNCLGWIASIAMALVVAAPAVARDSGQGQVRVRQDLEDMRQFNGLLKAAEVAFVNGNLPEAEEFYKKTLAIVSFGEARLNLAEIYERENRLEEAKAEYHRLVFP